MRKLVLMLSVDLDDATFAKICMQCGGFNRIPGTDMAQLPEFASVNLAKILEKGVREDNPVPPSVTGPGIETEQAVVDKEPPAVQAVTPTTSVSLAEASKDPRVQERAKGVLGSALGLRGKRNPKA